MGNAMGNFQTIHVGSRYYCELDGCDDMGVYGERNSIFDSDQVNIESA